MYENVQKGEAFSDALMRYRGVFPDFMVAMVSAGEQSGNMDTIMQDLSNYYQKQSKLNNTIKGAMTYPLVLGVLMLVIIIFMFVFIMPTFAGMYDDPNDMPALTKVMMGFSDSLVHQWYIYVVVIVGIVFGVTYMLKVPASRLKFDKMIIKMPTVGPLVGTIYTARFANTMASLYASGISMVDCLKRSSDILGNSYISMMFENVIDEVKQGETLSSSIQRTEIFDSMFCSIIYVGEEAGALDTILAKTGEYYDEEADSAVSRLVGLLEPLMIIIMGVAVGLLLAAIFPALYGSFDAIAA